MLLTILFVMWLVMLIFSIAALALGHKQLGRTALSLSLFTALFFATCSGAAILADRDAGLPYVLLALSLGALLTATSLLAVWGRLRRRAPALGLAALFLCWFGVAGYRVGTDVYEASLPVMADDGGDILADYHPYAEGTKVAVLDEPSTLTLTDDLPVIDGATGLYPVYSAFTRAIYPEEVLRESAPFWGGTVLCRRTGTAYRALVEKQVDIIFAAQPSEEQLAYAAEMGVEMVLTPIAREAFVFFVNAKNPIESLTVEEIQGIYSGEITSWRELGVRMGDIIPFQRSEGSGSQTALQALMGDIPLVKPPSQQVVEDMMGIIEVAADYKNYKEAIGFSFRFYSTEMVQNNQIRLLSINGVAPTVENIRSGEYPITSTLYAVTLADNDNPNVQAILDWVTSPQGQALVEATGYVPN